MEKDHAQPNPAPSYAGESEIPRFELLTLNQRQPSMVTQTVDCQIKSGQQKQIKTKHIQKERKCDSKNPENRRPNYKKKVDYLERRIQELQREICTLQRKFECCPNCRYNMIQGCIQNEIRMQQQEYLSSIAGSFEQKRNSRDSIEFEKMDLSTPMNFTSQMQEKTWVFLGTLMIIMGSKVMDVDGTLNVFKVLKQSVDQIRRQVEKCEEKINLDFFFIKQDLQQNSNIMKQLDFDPFSEKSHQGKLELEGVRVESVQEYELFYDRKTTFSVKYDGLITIMEYIKQHCWLS